MVRPADAPNVTFRLQAEPALRFTNSVGTVSDGAIFFWFDDDDRPAAAVQVYRTISGSWHQAFSSLSTVPLTAGSVWNPKRAGVKFKPVPGVPKPAATAEQRMRQMRESLDGFKSEMNLELKTWHHLRPLTKPLVRYGKTGTDVLDGGLFAFVLTTDPEVYLLLEAKNGDRGLEWQYAFAPRPMPPSAARGTGRKPGALTSTVPTTRAVRPITIGGFLKTGVCSAAPADAAPPCSRSCGAG